MLDNLLFKMGFKSDTPSNLHINNQLAIQVVKNTEHHSCMKQLDLKMFWLCDIVDRKIISPEFTWKEHMPVDILTKALPKVKIQLFSKMLGLLDTRRTKHKQSN